MIELLLIGGFISALIGAAIAPGKGMSPIVGFMAGALGIIGLAWLVRQDGA